MTHNINITLHIRYMSGDYIQNTQLGFSLACSHPNVLVNNIFFLHIHVLAYVYGDDYCNILTIKNHNKNII